MGEFVGGFVGGEVVLGDGVEIFCLGSFFVSSDSNRVEKKVGANVRLGIPVGVPVSSSDAV